LDAVGAKPVQWLIEPDWAGVTAKAAMIELADFADLVATVGLVELAQLAGQILDSFAILSWV
jgi:hypothetical protein